MLLTPAEFTIMGLIGNLAGVILLFRYGMPYAVRTGGADVIQTRQQDPEAIKREALYDRRGGLGLILIILGTLFQIIGALG